MNADERRFDSVIASDSAAIPLCHSRASGNPFCSSPQRLRRTGSVCETTKVTKRHEGGGGAQPTRSVCDIIASDSAAISLCHSRGSGNPYRGTDRESRDAALHPQIPPIMSLRAIARQSADRNRARPPAACPARKTLLRFYAFSLPRGFAVLDIPSPYRHNRLQFGGPVAAMRMPRKCTENMQLPPLGQLQEQPGGDRLCHDDGDRLPGIQEYATELLAMAHRRVARRLRRRSGLQR